MTSCETSPPKHAAPPCSLFPPLRFLFLNFFRGVVVSSSCGSHRDAKLFFYHFSDILTFSLLQVPFPLISLGLRVLFFLGQEPERDYVPVAVLSCPRNRTLEAAFPLPSVKGSDDGSPLQRNFLPLLTRTLSSPPLLSSRLRLQLRAALLASQDASPPLA